MKRYLKITLFAITLMLLLAVLTVGALAASDGATTEETAHNFKVVDKDGANATYYVDLTAAYAAIPDGGTLYFLNDYTSAGTTFTLTNPGDVTVDGQGFSLSARRFLVKTVATDQPTVTFKNLVAQGTDTYYAFHVGNAFLLQFENCNITSAGSIVHMNVSNAAVKFAGTKNVCTTNNDATSNRYMVVLQAGTSGHSVVVEGGTFTANGTKNPGFMHMNTAQSVTLSISGGSFSLRGGIIYNGGAGTVNATFTGGEFTMKAAVHMFRSASASGEVWNLTFDGGSFTPYAQRM